MNNNLTLEDEIKKYNISDTFYKRYFQQNAINHYANELMKFMWFKEGKFLNPKNQWQYINEFAKKEIENFYEKKLFVMPQLEVSITTKCTLRCKECCAFIPKFNQHGHRVMSFEEFKFSIDKILNSIDLLENLIFLGGEPLLNLELPKMIDYALANNKIEMAFIISNGTVKPSNKLLEVMKKYSTRIFVRMSDYSVNKDISNILKHEEIERIFKENNIKCQKQTDMKWLKELGFSKEKSTKEASYERFNNCQRVKCIHLIDKKIDICSKAYAGRELGYITNKDFIDLEKTDDLRKALIDFYHLDCISACEYCNITKESAEVAKQV